MTSVPKKIGIIGGSGALGAGLAKRWAKSGYQVVVGSRDNAKAQLAAQKLNEEANSASSASKDRKVEIKKNLLSAGKILGILENDPENWLGYNQKSKENSEEIERLSNERNEA